VIDLPPAFPGVLFWGLSAPTAHAICVVDQPGWLCGGAPPLTLKESVWLQGPLARPV
jgi:hypothetical protein